MSRPFYSEPIVKTSSETVTVKPTVAKNATVQPTPGLNLDKLAYAVAMAETKNCREGIGLRYNNCFGIKSGNTAPCSNVGYNNMCIYEDPLEGYEAFKKIWSTWYKVFPTQHLAGKWTGGDNPGGWLITVTQYYNE